METLENTLLETPASSLRLVLRDMLLSVLDEETIDKTAVESILKKHEMILPGFRPTISFKGSLVSSEVIDLIHNNLGSETMAYLLWEIIKVGACDPTFRGPLHDILKEYLDIEWN